jgi:hypothetical protein
MQKNKTKQVYMSKYRLCKYTLMTFALIAAGCAQQPPAPIGVKVQDNTLYIGQSRGIGKADTMDVTEDVLAEMHFTIEKADVDSGLIRTRPLPGAQFFEFWRSENVGADNSLAANLHSIRRTVELNVSQREGELCVGCDVRVQRLSIPEHQVSSSARVYKMFSRSSSSLQRLALNPEQQEEMAWINLDNDTRLAAEILKRIEARIVRRTSDTLQMTENGT